VKAIVLVGGEGTRLRPLTFTTPKQLLPVVEVPMLERVLEHLSRHGVEEAILSMGYRPDAFAHAYPSNVVAGVRLLYAVEPEPLDTAGAVRFAAEAAEVDETFLVVNGDVLTDMDVTALVEFHRLRSASATICLTPVEDPSRFGVVPTDPEGKVLDFIEKPPVGRAPTNLINAGTYVIEPEVLELVALGRRTSIERETFPVLASKGVLYAHASDAYWLDTGTPEAYLQAHADLLSGRRFCDPAPGATEIGPGVWVVGKADVDGQIGPQSLVGEGAVVATGASVERSVIGARSRIDPGALIEDSVVLSDAHIAPGAHVRRSIVGHRADIGAKCELDALCVVGDEACVTPGTRLEGARVRAEKLP